MSKEMCVESRLGKLKKEVRGVLLSCPRGLTINQFLKDYKESIGTSFPFSDLGYDSIPDLLRDISDVVQLKPGYGGEPSVLVPVSNDKVNHINTMVSRQKLAPNKFFQRSIPRRTVVQKQDPDSKTKKDQGFNGEETKTNIKKQSSYEDSHTNHSSLARSNDDYQSNLYSDGYYNSNCDVYNSNTDYDGFYQDEVHHSNEFGYELDYSSQKGFYDMPEEDLERPPTPGAVIITEKMKNNIRELLAENPEGILSSKFCKMYQDRFGVQLRYADYGMKSFQEMIADLPDVFAFQQQKSSAQWILYDARHPVPTTEMQKWIPYDILSNIAELAQSFPEGLKKSNLFFLYRERFRADLDVERLGFKSVESFLQACTSIDVYTSNGEDFVVPKSSYQMNTVDDEPSYPLPPVSDMPYLWRRHFCDDECDPSMTFQQFDTAERFKSKHNCPKVLVCDLISPSSLWLQMDEHLEQLNKLMLDLNEYYNEYEHKHALNDYSFVKSDLVCAVRFEADNRWHRAKILSSYSDSSNSVVVRYVDYGTESFVDISSICKLKKDFFRLPVQAVEASLYGVVSKPQDAASLNGNVNAEPTNRWTVESVDFIYNLCFDKKYTVDYFDINETMAPQLQVVLSDSNSDRTVNDQLLAEGYAVSIAHMLKSGVNNEERIRTPPGYSSRPLINSAPQKLSSALSTCDRVAALKEESLLLHREVERLQKEIKQKLLESEVLEMLVCKHNHAEPEGFDVVTKLYSTQLDQPSQDVATNDNRSQDSNKRNDDAASGNPVNAPQTVPPGSTYTPKPLNGSNLNRQGFNPVQNGMAGPDMRFGGHMPPEQMAPPMMQHQGPPHQVCSPPMQQQHHPYNNYSQQLSPAIHNKLVGTPLIVPNQSYMGVQMTPYAAPFHHQQQNLMYRPNMGQWGTMAPTTQWNHGPPPGMYEAAYRQPSYTSKPAPVRPMFTKPPSPKLCNPPPEAPAKVSTPPPKPVVPEEVHQVEIKPTAPPLDEEEPAVSVEAAEEAIPLEDAPVADEAHEDEMNLCVGVERIELSAPVTPSPSPPPPYNSAFLTQKMAKKLETIEDITVVPPPNNNWSALFSQNTPSSIVSSADSKYPNQVLLDLMRDSARESKVILEEEYNDIGGSDSDSISDLVDQQKEVVNHTMRICMENIHGRSSHVLLVLVEDSVAILLKQLFLNYWWDEYDEDSYEKMKLALIEDFMLAYSISLHDSVPIFDKLREEKLIDDEDIDVHLVNLDNVPNVLDVICPIEKHDLSTIKDMFVELSKLVLPVDEFWFKKDRSPSGNF